MGAVASEEPEVSADCAGGVPETTTDAAETWERSAWVEPERLRRRLIVVVSVLRCAVPKVF